MQTSGRLEFFFIDRLLKMICYQVKDFSQPLSRIE
jgi:hypothetical protein